MTLEIRAIRDQDIEDIVSLWHKCGLTRPWNNPHKDIDIAREEPSSEILVGIQNSDIVASVMCGFDGHRGWLYYVAVDPGCRGKGFGREITIAAENWLRDRGAPKVELMIRDDNFTVRDFYHSAGYTVEPRIVMAKWLKEPPAPQKETSQVTKTPALEQE
ncbi:GNAT family acetyltransferase [Aestuariispira ectoiniformans]|uniref:GNAT family acetyltransferase n=1 Tax=Aestuariispira ectoiniformans TaxID=2775080 RepID=UPI00223A6A6F|nr:GNAT family acetyltransferase [Aestuariispira ectoiniformans]